METSGVWRASTGFIEPISKLLKSLNLSRPIANVSISSEGVHIKNMSPAKTQTSQLFIESSLFATYFIEDEINFTINLRALVHSLQMFAEWSTSVDGHSTRKNRSYDGIDSLGLENDEDFEMNTYLSNSEKQRGICFLDFENNVFEVKFAFGNMSSVCKLNVFDENDAVAEIPFDNESVILQVILNGNVFQGLIRDWASVSTKEVTIAVNIDQEPAQLELGGRGDLATTNFVLPNDPKVVDAMFSEGNYEFDYDFNGLSECRDAVRMAKQVSLRYDINGTLSLQCLCQIGGYSAYIEYRMLPKV